MVKHLSVFLSLFINLQLGAQTLEQATYQNWLENTLLAELLEVDISEPNSAQNLTLKVLDKWDNPVHLKKLKKTWQQIQFKYEMRGLNVYEQMVLKWSQIARKPIDKASIRFKSSFPALFSGELYYEADALQNKMNMLGARGSGILTLNYETAALTDPNEKFLIKMPWTQASSDIPQFVSGYFENKPSCVECLIEQETISKGGVSLIVLSLKGEISGKYFEKVNMELWFFPLSKTETEFSYSLSASYAAGIVQAGEYKDVKSDFYAGLVALNSDLEKLIYKQFQANGG